MMIDIAVTFAFSVFTLYTIYRVFTMDDRPHGHILYRLAITNINWYIYYAVVATITIHNGSSVAREASIMFLKMWFDKFVWILLITIFLKQGKHASTLIHKIVNECDNAAVTSRVTFQEDL